MIDNIIKEAARIMKENPNLKYYEALIEAKKIIRDKGRDEIVKER